MIVTLLLAACANVAVPMHGGEAPPLTGSPIDAPTGTADWHVDANGSGDFTDIQDAIDAASSGDWILVKDGTYGPIDYAGKSLWISSVNGPSATIIDAKSRGYGVTATLGETSRTALVGFTVQNSSEAAVYTDFSSLHLEDVRLTDTTGNYVLYGHGSDLELQDVTIDNNDARTAVFYVWRGSTQLNSVTAECGRGGYLVYTGHGYIQIDWSDLECSGRASTVFYSEHTTGTILRSHLVGNLVTLNEDKHPEDSVDLYNTLLEGSYSATYGGILIRNSVVDGGKVTYVNNADYPGTPVIESSILLNSSCAFSSDSPSGTVRNSSFWNTTASCEGVEYGGVDGNLTDDPELVDADAGDYHLTPGSPLRNAGVDESGYEDVDGSRNDIGLYGGIYSQDGGW